MVHGEHPNTKRVKGRIVKTCESCNREMKTTDRCESHSNREPCYFCHLLNHHVKTYESSEKQPPKQTA